MRRWVISGVAGLAIVVVASIVRPYVHGLTLVIRAADLQGPIRRVADIDTVRVSERIVQVPLRDTSLRARVYIPEGSPRQTVLLVSGLHPNGIDEPRLVDLARKFAEANVTVVTPDIPGLSRFEIAPALTDSIEESAAWLARQSDLTPRGRIGLMGVSFSGGLAVVAAGRVSLRDRLLYVFSFGGHDDLGRVLGYCCAAGYSEGGPADRRPEGSAAGLPHDFGAAVVLLNVADRVVPPDQVDALRDGVRRFLWASYLDRFDELRADREFEALRGVARTLPQPAATFLGYVNDRDVPRLGPLLLPHLGPYAESLALSPSRAPRPSVPVLLLHGLDDDVIPAAESEHLAARLRGQVPVRLLLTNLLSHAEADQPRHVTDVLKLAGFWSDLLNR